VFHAEFLTCYIYEVTINSARRKLERFITRERFATIFPVSLTYLSDKIRTFIRIHNHSMNPCDVGPFHHGMARPQVADGGTASDMEGSCE